MTRSHALELVLSAEDDLAVRRRWHDLDRADLPSLAHHSGPTHRPHVTVVSSVRAPDEQLLARARALWAPLLPVSVPVSALVVLGGRRLTVAELLSPPCEVSAARAELAREWPGADVRPWVAHLSLSAALPSSRVGAVLEVLTGHPGDDQGPDTRSRTVCGLRWWNPEAEEVTTVAGVHE